MALHHYNPRYSDDLGLMQLVDEMTGNCPWGDYRVTPRDSRRHVMGPSPFGALARDCEVHDTDKEFRIHFNLQHYTPEEVKISADDTRITINAKHEEKQDHHGFVSREITRIFKMPADVDPRSITSSMNRAGRLNIRVQKQAKQPEQETSIPVEFKSK